MSTRLTKRRLEAMQAALSAKLAGIIDDEDLPLTRDDFDAASDWVIEQLERRERKK